MNSQKLLFLIEQYFCFLPQEVKVDKATEIETLPVKTRKKSLENFARQKYH